MERKVFWADLQFHPFSLGKNYGLLDILGVMERKGVDALGFLEYLGQRGEVFRILDEQPRELDKYIVDNTQRNAFSFKNKENGKRLYLILGEEVTPRNKEWHFLSIGALRISLWRDPRMIMDKILEKGGLLILDHPYADSKRFFADIPKEKEKELFLLCEEYKSRMALEWNGYCISWLRRIIPFYGDVNSKAKKLGQQLGIPVVPTTDVHAMNKKSLEAIGTCSIGIPSKDIDYNNIVQSLRENILSFNFEAREDYVSFGHFFRAFIVPYFVHLVHCFVGKIGMAAR